jgi:hypothetical protein
LRRFADYSKRVFDEQIEALSKQCGISVEELTKTPNIDFVLVAKMGMIVNASELET